MPKTNPFEKNNKLKEYTGGVEKIIYQSEDNPEEFIAVLKFKESESSESIKARYYLSKILYLLFPQNIPNIYFAQYNKQPVLILERKFLDENHNYLNQNYSDFSSRVQNLDFYFKFRSKIYSDENYKRLSKELSLLGIFLDPNPLNFGYDKDGNLVYVDNSFTPWFVDDKGQIIAVGYNLSALKQKINEKLPNFLRAQALNYLERLEKLREDYENKIKQNKK